MTPPVRTANALAGRGSGGVASVSAIQRHMPVTLLLLLCMVATLDVPDREKTELFASLFVSVCLNLARQSLRCHSVGVTPKGLDSR